MTRMSGSLRFSMETLVFDTVLPVILCLPIEMPTVIQSAKRFLFKIIAKSAIAIYSRLPIFGDLRAALAVIRKDGLILMIDRNDGRGLSFPGGLSHFGEPAERSMRREVLEETGLQVDEARLLFEYRSTADIPCKVVVFAATATGQLGGSWEGTPRWLSPAEVQGRVLASQIEVVRRISSTA